MIEFIESFSEVDKKWQIRSHNIALDLLGNKLIIWYEIRGYQIFDRNMCIELRVFMPVYRALLQRYS